ncbi:unnamed protein product [Cylindrotheca closterium]|uniref:Peroxisomal membrane protein MPV17 n=1 Tax=Cylindrotheca closterium TaxID=2856 RepID=A0AAD2PWF0_9STRA|nr:unnamed protein product [Cylindrotheca closterium]
MSHIIRYLASFLLLQQASSLSLPDVTAVTSQLSHISPHLAAHSFAPSDLLDGYKELLNSNPLPTKMLTGATLAVCGDAIAQSKDDNEYDKPRAASFAAFDMVYRAVQHFSFPIIVAACHGQYLGAIPLVGDIDVSQLSAMEQTLASQLGIVPFFYYPVFFSLTGAIQGLSVSGAMDRAKENFVPLMKRNLLFWIPVQFIQFGYIQEDLQIPFLSMCGLAWTFILSVAAGSAKSYTPEEETEIITPGDGTSKDDTSTVAPVTPIVQRS